MKSKIEKRDRQLELLKKHYDVDEEKKMINISLRYKDATDVVVEDLGKKECPQFEKDVLYRINEVAESLPIGYKANVEIAIDDYLEYTPEIIKESFNDELELNHFSFRHNRRKKWLVASLLVVIGVIILIFMAAGNMHGWFGAGTEQEIITEIIDICATVLIWEAVGMLFLEPSQEGTLGLTFKKRIASFSLLDKDQNVLLTENNKEMFREWQDEKFISKVGKFLLLFSSAAFICMAFYSIYNIYRFTSSGEESQYSFALLIAFTCIYFLVHLLAGVGGFLKYIGVKNWISKFVGLYSLVLICLIITSIVLSAFDQNISFLVSSVSSLVFNVFYIAGYLIDKKY